MTLITEQMFFKKVFDLIKRDDSFFNCVCQVIDEYQLDGYEVGEWIKKDKTMTEYIKAEFKINKNLNDLF